MAYAGALAELFARSTRGMKFDLRLMRSLLARLGRPDRAMHIVHVAGTNGKGSTSALLARALLLGGGPRVGLFTSPHVLRFVERIRICGRTISERQAVALFEQIKSVERRLERPPTFFECSCAMALLAFEQAGVELAILEVGLGGRLDATNAVATQSRVLTLLTPVSHDHQSILGHSLTAIAREKAGVMRRGVPALSAPQRPACAKVFQNVAQARRCKWTMLAAHDGESHLKAPIDWPPYLSQNARLVAAAMQQLSQQGFPIRLGVLPHAMRSLRWPGRFSWLPREKKNGPDVLLDCAHNAAGAEALATALDCHPRCRGRRKVLVVGTLADKDAGRIVAALRPHAVQLHLCVLDHPRTRTLAQLRRWGQAHASFPEAWEVAKRHATADTLMVIAGSTFLVAEALRHLKGRRADPPVRG